MLKLRLPAINFELIKVAIIAVKDILSISFHTGNQITIYDVQFTITPEFYRPAEEKLGT